MNWISGLYRKLYRKLAVLQGSEVCDQWQKVQVESHYYEWNNPRQQDRLGEGKAILQKRPRGEKSQTYIRLHQQKFSQQVEGNDYSSQDF